MTKTDLINEVAQTTGLSKAKTGEALDAIVQTIQSALSKGEKVTLVGFGSWETQSREARKGRNPKNGEEIAIPAKRVARFKAGSGLSAAVAVN